MIGSGKCTMWVFPHVYSGREESLDHHVLSVYSKVMIKWNSLTAPMWRFWCGASAIGKLSTHRSIRGPRQSCDSGPAVPV